MSRFTRGSPDAARRSSASRLLRVRFGLAANARYASRHAATCGSCSADPPPSISRAAASRRLQQRIAALVARARDDSVDGHQQGAVVGPQAEHGGVDMGAGEELLKQARIRHR